MDGVAAMGSYNKRLESEWQEKSKEIENESLVVNNVVSQPTKEKKKYERMGTSEKEILDKLIQESSNVKEYLQKVEMQLGELGERKKKFQNYYYSHRKALQNKN